VLIQAAALWAAGNDPGRTNSSQWHIGEVYKYLNTLADELSPDQIDRYCRFLIDCQKPDTGNFVDAHGGNYYSLKVYHTLERFGRKPKYPLGVCQNEGTEYCIIDGVTVSEKMPAEMFRKWLDKIRRIEDAYGAGSSFGHFIEPHVFNLRNAGKPLGSSPYIKVFQQGLVDNQGENGFWNRLDDPEYNGWNGVMKMDGALAKAGIKVPRQDRMIRTVLKYQNPKDGSFTAAGGCTNHNALHTLRQWSKRNRMLMGEDIFRAMELFTECLERRWDPVSGYFRPVPGFTQPPQFRATELAGMAAGNVIGYCRILLDPENRALLDKQLLRKGQDRITPDRIRSLLVRAMGIDALARDKIKEHLKAEHDRKYEQKSGQQQ